MGKKNYLLFLLTFLIVFLLLSCSQNIVKGTVWKGKADGFKDFYDSPAVTNDKGDLECYFNPDNTMKAYVTLKYKADGLKWTETVQADGDYTIDLNYNINADLSGKFRNKYAEFDVEMDGILNTTTGAGNGDFKIKFKNGFKIKGDWNLTKINSY